MSNEAQTSYLLASHNGSTEHNQVLSVLSLHRFIPPFRGRLTWHTPSVHIQGVIQMTNDLAKRGGVCSPPLCALTVFTPHPQVYTRWITRSQSLMFCFGFVCFVPVSNDVKIYRSSLMNRPPTHPFNKPLRCLFYLSVTFISIHPWRFNFTLFNKRWNVMRWYLKWASGGTGMKTSADSFSGCRPAEECPAPFNLADSIQYIMWNTEYVKCCRSFSRPKSGRYLGVWFSAFLLSVIFATLFCLAWLGLALRCFHLVF